MKTAIAAALACLAVVGCSTSASGPAASAPKLPLRDGHGVAITATPTWSAAGGRVHLTDETDNDSPTSGVILTGTTTGPDGRQRVHGELVFGRRIPTKAEIAAINAQIAAMDAAAAATCLARLQKGSIGARSREPSQANEN